MCPPFGGRNLQKRRGLSPAISQEAVGGCGALGAAALLVYALDFNRITSGFATLGEIALVVLVGGAAGYLLLARKRAAFALCVLVPHIWSYGLVNPVAVGLAAMLDSRLFQELSRVVVHPGFWIYKYRDGGGSGPSTTPP
jgi:hypothetical protein